MKGNLLALAIDSIRTDGGTQVRDQLDEMWVSELMDLYREGHEIDPVLVVVESQGGEETTWLADGFHRVEAQRRIGCSTVKATVRTGPAATLDMAKMLAAAANKNGRPLKAGEKRNAVLMARSTPEGRTMGVRDLARHCGVAAAYVSEILGGSGCSAPNTVDAAFHPANGHGKTAALWGRIDAALRADTGRPDKEIATELDCHDAVVRRRRAALGLPKSDTTRRRPSPERDKAAELLREHPGWTNKRLAEESGATQETVAKVRARSGMAPSPRGGKRASDAPSAPARKDDPRDKAEVIQAHPQPTPQRFTCSARRDMATVILNSWSREDKRDLHDLLGADLAGAP